MPLVKVTDLTHEQTAFGRLLDYGSFIIESARAGAGAEPDRLPARPQPALSPGIGVALRRYAVQTQDDGIRRLVAHRAREPGQAQRVRRRIEPHDIAVAEDSARTLTPSRSRLEVMRSSAG